MEINNENVLCDLKDIFDNLLNTGNRMWIYKDTGNKVIDQSDEYKLTIDDIKHIMKGLEDGTIVVDPLWNTNNKRRYNVETLIKTYDKWKELNTPVEHNNSSKPESSEEKHTPSSNEDNDDGVTIPFKVNFLNDEDCEICPRIVDGRIVSFDICRKKKD